MAISKLIEDVLAEFDPSTVDFETVKKNVLAYSSINMAYGKLRSVSPPEIPFESGVVVDPAAAEKEDRQRQMATPTPQKSTFDPEAVTLLSALHTENHGFLPFDFKQNIVNAICATVAITGHLPTATEFKQNYLSCLNSIQNTSIPCRDTVVISFDNPVLLNELCREGLIAAQPGHVFPPPIQERIAHHISDGFAFIKAVDEDLHDAIMLMIGTIAPIQREGSSGTVSSMIGLLWLNPTPTWTVIDYAENIVHEFIHNTIFLADLVWKIFITPHWYTPQDGLVTSAIKKYPRGVNISYHSVFVAVGLIIFMNKAHQHLRAEELTSGIQETLAGLTAKSERFLSPYACEALKGIDIYRPVAT